MAGPSLRDRNVRTPILFYPNCFLKLVKIAALNLARARLELDPLKLDCQPKMSSQARARLVLKIGSSCKLGSIKKWLVTALVSTVVIWKWKILFTFDFSQFVVYVLNTVKCYLTNLKITLITFWLFLQIFGYKIIYSSQHERKVENKTESSSLSWAWAEGKELSSMSHGHSLALLSVKCVRAKERNKVK